MKRKITSIMLAIIMTVALSQALSVYAVTTITPEGGDQNGTDWTWVAATKTLTLSGINDISADEITFSGEFGLGCISIENSNTGTTPTINFNNFSITGSVGGTPTFGSGIYILRSTEENNGIIFDFTGTNTIQGRSANDSNGGFAIYMRSYGFIEINGSVNLYGGIGRSDFFEESASGGTGIFSYGDVIINATGPVNINGGDTDVSSVGSGIYALSNASVTINGLGEVNISSGDITNPTIYGGGYGIEANNVTLNNPNTTIRGGDSYSSQVGGKPGIYANTVTITESVTIIGGDCKVQTTSQYGRGGEAIISTGLVKIQGSGVVTLLGGNNSTASGNGGHGIKLKDTGSITISNPNTIITGGNGSGSGENLGFAGSAVYINNATQTITLPYSNISNLVAGTGTTNGSKIFIGADYYVQTSGRYNTLAEMEENTTQISLSVTEPTAPTAVTANAGNGQASVSFAAPSSDGGSPITSYTVTSSPSGITATGAASPLLVTGLTNGTAYTFTVTATNTAGTGSSSAPSSAVTPVEPVTNITGVATTGTVGTGLALSGTVAPADATNNTIVWSVKSGTATMTGANQVTATTAGDVVVTATITNGLTESSNYTQDFTITFSNSYKAVTNITSVPTTGIVGTRLALSGTVAPADATNNTIVWSVKSGTATMTGASEVTATAAGNVVVTATITNGLTESSNYTQDFTITFSNSYKAVTNITGVATTGTVGTGLSLSGTVAPADATNNTIVWSVKSGTATMTGASEVTATAAGDVVVTATITNGLTESSNYTQDFTITMAEHSSGNGGSSGGGSTTTTVINTNTGNITGNQLDKAAGVAKDGETVTINSNKTSKVTFPSSGLDSLIGNNNSLTVVTDKGTLTFDSKAVASIGTQADATEIIVIVDDVVKTTMTENQQAKVGDKTVYDLTVMSGGKLISNFNGGKVNVGIPYELKEDETADNLTVWYMADDGSLTEIDCTYDASTKAVTFVVEHFSKYIIGYDDSVSWKNPFTDVKSSAWYYDAVAFVNMDDLMKGQTGTSFGAQMTMTRGMFVTILGRMEGVDASMYANKNTFSDVMNDQYYTPYIAWASDKGIVSGVGGDKFSPNADVTREQMAVMMTNYMKFKEQGPKGEWTIQLTYGDLDKVSSWANEGVMFMTMKELMKGMGDDKKGLPLFDPKSALTRAQAAQVIMNLEGLLK